ncbi:pyocin R2_PP, tail formation GPD [Pseudomonas amygdali pv. mori str. 301020]|uniref:Pyocin R2_PP, tail formation GPD n=1 Tax=Pseudomonas amygdali pv. mori str. 301020 TaxID=629261 RepID=A0A656GK31_PSEA0|nr:pyocin R2_PP, tail formation GPD [Pseudomonas amygdali pv. mori str. 301020]
MVDSVEQVFTQSGWTTVIECNGGKSGKAQGERQEKERKKPVKVVQL